MILASEADIPEIGRSRGPAAAATALAVGLLVAGTLGTVCAVIVGASLHLLGVPDDWAAAAAVLTAAAGVVPAAALARRVWQVERHGPEA